MSWEYSENILVQGAAGDLLEQELGWRVVFAYNKEKLGADGTLGRTDYREILLKRDFRTALKKLNPWLTDAQLTEAEKQSEKLFWLNQRNPLFLNTDEPSQTGIPRFEVTFGIDKNKMLTITADDLITEQKILSSHPVIRLA